MFQPFILLCAEKGPRLLVSPLKGDMRKAPRELFSKDVNLQWIRKNYDDVEFLALLCIAEKVVNKFDGIVRLK